MSQPKLQSVPGGKPRELRFRQLAITTTDTIGLTGVAGNVLVGLDDFGRPWYLATSPDGGVYGWIRIFNGEPVPLPAKKEDSPIITGQEVQSTIAAISAKKP